MPQDVQFQEGADIPGFYDGPWTPGQGMARQYPEYPEYPDQVPPPPTEEEMQQHREHLFNQTETVKKIVAEAIKKQPSFGSMFNHIHCLAIAEGFLKEFAEIYTNIYVHFMVEHNQSGQPTEDLNKMGSQIALNYVINYSCVFSRPYKTFPPPVSSSKTQ